jgi:hypothetical protein
MELVPLKPSLWTENLPVQTTINPKLAKEIGLNESLMLLQIGYWINATHNLRDNEWWTFQSLQEMKEHAFPYWSIATIGRIINALVDLNLIKKTDVYNKRKSDRTQWFTLNIDGIAQLESIQVNFSLADVKPSENKKTKSRPTISQDEKSISQNEKTISQDETALPKYIPKEIPKESTTSPLAAENATDGNTQQAKKSKPATPNDPLFNWVAWNCFDLDPFAEIHKPELKRNSGRIGKIKAYLLEKAATIEQLDRFKAYYAHNMAGYSMPKDDAKFSVHFKKFLDNSKPVGVANIDPPKRPSVRDFVVFEKPEGKKAAGE